MLLAKFENMEWLGTRLMTSAEIREAFLRYFEGIHVSRRVLLFLPTTQLYKCWDEPV